MGSSSLLQRKLRLQRNQRDFRQHSLSPLRPSSVPRPSPPVKPPAFTTRQDFCAGTSRKVYSACAVCLGHHPHKIVECASTMLWDNSLPCLAVCSNKLLSMRDGKSVCSDWQRHSICSSSTHDVCHFCSGCASSSHGAQECPQAQKIPSSHSL